MSEIQPMHDANIRSQSYFIATTTAQCWHCGSPTRVLALAVPGGHETLNEDGEVDAWHGTCGEAFLFYVERLPDPVRDRLAQVSHLFHLSDSQTTLNSYWASHCESCGRLLEDHELHCEPDGPFAPSSEATAARIQLLQVHEQFEAAAAGYAFDPEFVEFMPRS
jgi:hypothetical protein